MQGVSVYIPVSGPTSALRYCLDGLLNQTRMPDEIILIHDGTFKRIKSIARRYAHKVRLIQLTQKLGRAYAKNVALHSAKYDLVASLHPNCVPQKNWLRSLVQQMRQQSNLIGAGGPLVDLHTDSLTNQYRSIHFQRNQGDDLILNPSILHGGNTIYRRQSILAIGGYNDKLQNNKEDIELTQRIRATGGALVYEPKACAYRLRRDSILSLMTLQWESLRRNHCSEQSCRTLPSILRDSALMVKTIWQDQVLPDLKCKRFMLGALGMASMAVVPIIEWKSTKKSDKNPMVIPIKDS